MAAVVAINEELHGRLRQAVEAYQTADGYTLRRIVEEALAAWLEVHKAEIKDLQQLRQQAKDLRETYQDIP